MTVWGREEPVTAWAATGSSRRRKLPLAGPVVGSDGDFRNIRVADVRVFFVGSLGTTATNQ